MVAANLSLFTIIGAVCIGVIAIIAYIGYGYKQIGTRYRNALNAPSIYIIDERDIEKDPFKHAQLMLEEMTRVLATDTDSWYSELVSENLTVHSRPIEGPLSVHKAPIQRAFSNVRCKSAQDLFNFMISPDGFAVIDPITPKEEHLRPPAISYKWEKGRLEVAIAKVPLPWPFRPREFVVLNVIDEATKTFVSKSILPPKQLLESNATNPNAVKALNTFGLHIEDIYIPNSDTDTDTDTNKKRKSTSGGSSGGSSGFCKVSSIDFAAGIIGDLRLQHYVNAVMFYPGLFQRLEDALLLENNEIATASK